MAHQGRRNRRGRHRGAVAYPPAPAASRTPQGSRSPGRSAILGAFFSVHRVAFLVAAIIAAALFTGVRVAHTSPPTPEQAAAQSATAARVLVPADGALSVGSLSVAQMLGACDGSSCYHIPPAAPVTLALTSATVSPMRAGQSTIFMVASAYAEDGSGTSAPFTVTGADLHADAVKAGTYIVTVSGVPNGGMWLFRATVS